MTPSCVCIVPMYKSTLSKAELFALRRNYHTLSNYPWTVVCPASLQTEIAELLEKWGLAMTIQCFEDGYFANIKGYNRLLRSKLFYRAFDAFEYMLICQLDALIVRDELAYWCAQKYAYIGAPLLYGYDQAVQPFRILGGGNGGLSLRKIPAFIAAAGWFKFYAAPYLPYPDRTVFRSLLRRLECLIIGWMPYQYFSKLNEDIFWSFIVPHNRPDFKVAPSPEAIRFAFDNEPAYFYALNGQQLPFGCHAWERFDKSFWIEKLALPVEELT